MIERLACSLRSFFGSFAARRIQKPRADSAGKEVIRGCAGNVIIVKSPNTEYFKEAIFILCDDLLSRRGVSEQQLLDEARRAACAYCDELAPPRDAKGLRYLLFFLLGALSVLIVLTLLKLF